MQDSESNIQNIIYTNIKNDESTTHSGVSWAANM